MTIGTRRESFGSDNIRVYVYWLASRNDVSKLRGLIDTEIVIFVPIVATILADHRYVRR